MKGPPVHSSHRSSCLAVSLLASSRSRPAGGLDGAYADHGLCRGSLTNVFPAIDPNEKYSFGGSNALAAQITQGAPADVFASADMSLPTQLFQQGLCSKPVVFTRNKLVIVVPGQSGPHPQHLRPDEVGREDRHRRQGRSGRQLHAADPAEHEPDERGPEERRQPGNRRAGGARQGRTR